MIPEPTESRGVQAALAESFYSPDPAVRQRAVDAITDFTRMTAREHGLQLPVLLVDGVIPLYASDFVIPNGEPPRFRRLVSTRVWLSPFAIPDPHYNDRSDTLEKRAPEVNKLLKEMVEKATAAVLANQDRRIASLLMVETRGRLQAALEGLLAKIPWTPEPPAVDAEPAS